MRDGECRVDRQRVAQLVFEQRRRDGGQQCDERFGDGRIHQMRRGIIRARAMSFVGGHEILEGSTEHLRIDGGLRPGGGVFVGGESIAIEHARDQGGEGFVAEMQTVRASLERRGCEEAAIQKRHPPELSGCRRP